MALILNWDASAILSLLVEDEHSPVARACAAREGVHVMSSLAFAETASVLTRVARSPATGVDPRGRIDAARAFWRFTPVAPGPAEIEAAATAGLRGADTWHLGFHIAAERETPGLKTLTFDRALAAALRVRGGLFAPSAERR